MSSLLKNMRSPHRNPESLFMCEVIHRPFHTPPGLMTLAKHTREKRQELQKPGSQALPTATVSGVRAPEVPGPCTTDRACKVNLRISKTQPAQAGPLPSPACQYTPKHSMPGPASSAQNRNVIVLCEVLLSALPFCSPQIFRKMYGQRLVNQARQLSIFLGKRRTASRMDPLLFYE